jgi:hypothetical protein
MSNDVIAQYLLLKALPPGLCLIFPDADEFCASPNVSTGSPTSFSPNSSPSSPGGGASRGGGGVPPVGGGGVALGLVDGGGPLVLPVRGGPLGMPVGGGGPPGFPCGGADLLKLFAHSLTDFMLIIFGIFLQHCSIKEKLQLLNHLFYLLEYTKWKFFILLI